jgi:hypothetical protein
MNIDTRFFRPLLLVACIALLGACDPGTTVSSDAGTVRAKGDRITLSATGMPSAQITRDGELFIDGEKVQVDDAQRALLQTYQRELNGMTEDGIAMGKQGAAMAGKAVTAAIQGALSGDGDKIGEKIEAEARLMEKQALKLCERLLVIKAAQDQLATQLPQFKPYANIGMDDVTDCSSQGNGGDGTGDAAAEAETAGVEAEA